MNKLNLGSGMNRPVPDSINVDVNLQSAPDLVSDLNRFPWPFSSNTFQEIYGYDILEHLDDIVSVMNEIHRIAAPGAKVVITTPHFSNRNAFTDPTHKHYFGIHSFDYFSRNGKADYSKWNFYSSARYEILKVAVQFEHNLVNKLIWRIAARYPDMWESRLAWIFPAWFMNIELRVVKS